MGATTSTGNDNAKFRRGRLKIFLGAAPGVGKTHAMLAAAAEQQAGGRDVVAGPVETHGMAANVALVERFESLPPVVLRSGKLNVYAFDLPAALVRMPELLLMDDLAHSNPEGARHLKRHREVEELLAAGIDVYCTLNVYQLASLKDIVWGLTQSRSRQWVPDEIFEQADEVVLVDIAPLELIRRLDAGYVHIPGNSERFRIDFFRKENLVALRNLAAHRITERIDAQMRAIRDMRRLREFWPSGNRVLVCIGNDPQAGHLIRAGKRLANQSHVDWIVAHVEGGGSTGRDTEADREATLANLRMAEAQGAETVILSGHDARASLLAFAKDRSVSRILLGKPRGRLWRRWLRQSLPDQILRSATDMDIHVLTDKDSTQAVARKPGHAAANPGKPGLRRVLARVREDWHGYLAALIVPVLASTAGALLFGRHDIANLVLLYTFGTILVARRHGFAPAAATSVLSVLALDFFFIPPVYSFIATRLEDAVMLAIMLAVALVVANLTAALKRQAESAAKREHRANLLYGFTADLANTRTAREVATVVTQHVGEHFRAHCALLLPDPRGHLGAGETPRGRAMHFADVDLVAAQAAFEQQTVTGLGCDKFPDARGVYFPIATLDQTHGVLALRPADLQSVFSPDQRRLLDTFIAQVAQALERMRLARETEASAVQVETESLRNSLLNAIAHDLRTPLASIVAASSGLLTSRDVLDGDETRILTETVYDEAVRMTKLANKILDMARLEAGAVTLNLGWYPVDEIVASVLTRLNGRLADHVIETELPADLALMRVDSVMIEQVLENLVENAVKYSPAGTRITVGAQVTAKTATVWVADNGPGLPAGAEEKVFEKFYRARAESAQSGAGLGLTICKAIIEAHRGRMTAQRNHDGGATFTFDIPVKEQPPQYLIDEMRTADVR
jgi:two-component system sensor histidine kinase KdpD